MDYNAINTAISKAYNKYEKIGLGQLNESTVGITTDGLVMWFVPEILFIFDKTKLLKRGGYLDVKTFANTDGYEDAVKTDKLVSCNKKTLAIFECKGVETFVDSKLLKTFDRIATFKVKSPVSPVLVYEGDTLVGLVMPSRPPKKEV